MLSMFSSAPMASAISHPVSSSSPRLPVGSSAPRAPHALGARSHAVGTTETKRSHAAAGSAKAKTSLISRSRKLTGKQSSRSWMASDLPPPYNASVTIRKQRFRFRATASAGGTTVSTVTLAAICGGQSGGAGIMYTFASSFRLRSITCWPPSTTSDTVNLTWSPSFTNQVKDTVMSTTIPDGITVTRAAHFVPPKNSLISEWMVAGAAGISSGITIANIVSMPEGTIVDVVMDYTLAGGLPALEVIVSGGTLSNTYYAPLDVASKLLNVDLPSISY
jgi:hypothetical protein